MGLEKKGVMKFIYVAIGDELLKGESREGNGAVLAAYLQKRGLELSEIRVLSDDPESTCDVLSEFSTEACLVIMSGGLGPTDDDLTRDAVARACGVPLETEPSVVDRLKAWAELRGRSLDPSNMRQAKFPKGSNILKNANGTAPGFSIRHKLATVVCFPGVPREFREMVDAHLPDLLTAQGVVPESKLEITFRIFGITESGLQGLLRDIPGYSDMHMRSLPTFPEIRLVLSSEGPDETLYRFAGQVRAQLGWRVFSEDPSIPYAELILDSLGASDQTLALAESCSGGLIAYMLTGVPGASRSLMAGVVAYSNESKTALLGVPEETIIAHGAVSGPTASAMARGARDRCGASIGLSVTGIAGPGGGTDEKPVGTFFVGLATDQGVEQANHSFPGLDRERFQRLVAYVALNTLRRHLTAARD